MKNTVLVVADLGGFKTYRLEDGQFHRTPRLELLEAFSNPGAHSRLVDTVTDLSGRFGRGTGIAAATGAMSDGERHNIELEARKRLVRRMAQRLNVLIRGSDVDRCFLAASREINRQLLDELDVPVRAKIERNIPADLTKTDKADLLRHFQPPAEAGPAEPRVSA
jgi:hypothetical protein